ETNTESRLEISYSEFLLTNPSVNKLNKKFEKANRQIQQVEDRRAPVNFTNMHQHQAQNRQQTPPSEFDNQQALQTLLRGINEMFESNAAQAAIATTNPKEYKLIDFFIFLEDNDKNPIE
ncbi:5514_t:CDS:2, partial [Dentiscutata erythropus]